MALIFYPKDRAMELETILLYAMGISIGFLVILGIFLTITNKD